MSWKAPIIIDPRPLPTGKSFHAVFGPKIEPFPPKSYWELSAELQDIEDKELDRWKKLFSYAWNTTNLKALPWYMRRCLRGLDTLDLLESFGPPSGRLDRLIFWISGERFRQASGSGGSAGSGCNDRVSFYPSTRMEESRVLVEVTAPGIFLWMLQKQ